MKDMAGRHLDSGQAKVFQCFLSKDVEHINASYHKNRKKSSYY